MFHYAPFRDDLSSGWNLLSSSVRHGSPFGGAGILLRKMCCLNLNVFLDVSGSLQCLLVMRYC